MNKPKLMSTRVRVIGLDMFGLVEDREIIVKKARSPSS